MAPPLRRANGAPGACSPPTTAANWRKLPGASTAAVVAHRHHALGARPSDPVAGITIGVGFLSRRPLWCHRVPNSKWSTTPMARGLAARQLAGRGAPGAVVRRTDGRTASAPWGQPAGSH